MKRVLFLLLMAASAMSVSAQKDYRDNDRDERYHYKHDRYKDVRHRRDAKIHAREYQRQLASINYSFDSRIRSVRDDRYLRRGQKKRQIRELESHRRIALNECRDRFAGNRQRVYAREKTYTDRKR